MENLMVSGKGGQKLLEGLHWVIPVPEKEWEGRLAGNQKYMGGGG